MASTQGHTGTRRRAPPLGVTVSWRSGIQPFKRVIPCWATSLSSPLPHSPVQPLLLPQPNPTSCPTGTPPPPAHPATHTPQGVIFVTPLCLCKCCSHCLERTPHLFLAAVFSHVTYFWNPSLLPSPTPGLSEGPLLHSPRHASPSRAPTPRCCTGHVPPPRL